MPYDPPRPTASNASNNNNTNNGRPLMPALASNRTVRSPLTPRLAVQQNGIGSTTASVTPASRRSMRSDVSAAKSPPPSREDLTTPIKAFINTNVTPRSSSRKSRADSAQSTPDANTAGTPTANPKFVAANGDRVDGGPYSTATLSQPSFNTGIMGAGATSRRPHSMIAGGGHVQTPPLARPPLAGRATSPARDGPPMFFHASDAKSQGVPEPARPPLKKGPSFFYADGSQGDKVERASSSSPPAGLPSPPLSGLGTASSRFFHADGSAERASQASLPLASPPLAPITPQVQLSTSAINHMPNLRPASPNKDNIHLSYRKGASQIMRPASILPARQLRDESSTQRRTSVGSSKRTSHVKGSSLSSIDSASNVSDGKSASRRSSLNITHAQRQATEATKAQSIPSPSTVPPTSIQMPPLTIDVQPLVATPGSVGTPLSPTKGGMSQQMTEMAAQARRERKVMDLEISNSSLLAINRQLEREVRKQKAELRSYRRLTRAGRLSVAAAADTLLADDDEGRLGSDDSDADEDDDGGQHGASSLLSEDDDDDMALSESDESAMSPAALAEHDRKRISRDEKRLRLDLSKHRQLLVDSQKMNQSLRRCLGWTEELISEGKKALSWRVRVSDVKLGGRVLRRDDDDFVDALEGSHVDDDYPPVIQEGDEDDADSHIVEDQDAKDIGEVMSLMSPWLRSGPRSGAGTPILPADTMAGSVSPKLEGNLRTDAPRAAVDPPPLS